MINIQVKIIIYMKEIKILCFFFFSSRRRHTRCYRDWSSDVCSSDLRDVVGEVVDPEVAERLRLLRRAVDHRQLVESRNGRGDRRHERLAEEGTQRDVLPGLHVTRAPVVHE